MWQLLAIASRLLVVRLKLVQELVLVLELV
jgi:hypothetical protein